MLVWNVRVPGRTLDIKADTVGSVLAEISPDPPAFTGQKAYLNGVSYFVDNITDNGSNSWPCPANSTSTTG